MAEDFRIADSKDFNEIVRIFRAAIENMCSQGILQWDELYPNESILREDILIQQMYVLTVDERIISAVVINDKQDEKYKSAQWQYENERIAVLHRLCVNPAFQNKGYGRKTVLLAEQVMKNMGYTAVRFDAFSGNPFALKLYEGLGYIKAGEVSFRKGRFFLYEKKL